MTPSWIELGGALDTEPLAARPTPSHAVPGTWFSCGRGSLARVLDLVRPARAYLPAWACDTLVEPFAARGVAVARYPIGPDLRPRALPAPTDDALLVVIVPFGDAGPWLDDLRRAWARRLMVDATQGYPLEGFPDCWTFNSARKFFGVPDGSMLWGPEGVDVGAAAEGVERSDAHLRARAEGAPEARALFRRHEATFGPKAEAPSRASVERLGQLDHQGLADDRLRRWHEYHRRLAATNTLVLPAEPTAAPLAYPYLPAQPVRHQALWDVRAWVPVFWPECEGSPDAFVRELAGGLLPLPVDRRTTEAAAAELCDIVLALQRR